MQFGMLGWTARLILEAEESRSRSRSRRQRLVGVACDRENSSSKPPPSSDAAVVVEVAPSTNHLIKDCTRSLAALQSPRLQHRQQEQGTFWSLSDLHSSEACLRLESDCWEGLLHASVVLDAPIALAVSILCALHGENTSSLEYSQRDNMEHSDSSRQEDDGFSVVGDEALDDSIRLLALGSNASNGGGDADRVRTASRFLHYSTLVQEASVNNSRSCLELLLDLCSEADQESPPRLLPRRRCRQIPIQASQTGEPVSDLPAPFRPCRASRTEFLRFAKACATASPFFFEDEHFLHQPGDIEPSFSSLSGVEDFFASSSFLSVQLRRTSRSRGSHVEWLREQFESCAERVRRRYSVNSLEPAMANDESELECAREILRLSTSDRGDEAMAALAATLSGGSSSSLLRWILHPPMGSSPLHWTSYKGHVACAALLLRWGADPNTTASETG
jgi:hypothetical protein